jgi:hypothetical protein
MRVRRFITQMGSDDDWTGRSRACPLAIGATVCDRLMHTEQGGNTLGVLLILDFVEGEAVLARSEAEILASSVTCRRSSTRRVSGRGWRLKG